LSSPQQWQDNEFPHCRATVIVRTHVQLDFRATTDSRQVLVKTFGPGQMFLICMKENTVTALGRTVILIAVFFIGVYVGSLDKNPPAKNQDVSRELQSEETVSLMIDYGDGTLDIFDDLTVATETPLFDVIDTATKANGVELTYTDYGGDLGVFIETIGGVGGGSEDMWWQYWVNNKYGQIGVSSYILEQGDVIEMKFIKGQL
jgi:hypothetical protein